MNKLKYFVFVILLLSVIACSKTSKSPIVSKVLCHRGSGVGYLYINGDTIYENTFNAAKYGFDNYDGIEIDIQKSKSNTLWVYHNSDLYQLDSLSPICVPSSTDAQIVDLNNKLPIPNRLSTLEQILKYRQSINTDKFISLDVKGYFDVNCIKGRNVSKDYEIITAKEIVRLINKYQLQDFVLVETDYLDVLKTVKKLNPQIKCFVLGYNNFDKRLQTAKDINANGLSFNFRDSSLTADAIKKLHYQGMEIQIWTINSQEELIKAKALKADFIQTDH